MKVTDLLKERRKHWRELEQLCAQVESGRRRALGAAALSRFAALYRAACADLALADAYQLPPGAVQYLHRLVGRAHNQLYRSRRFNPGAWGRMLLVKAPQRIFNDRCVHVAFFLFWGVFIVSAVLATSKALWPNYAEQILSRELIEAMEQMHSNSVSGGYAPASPVAASFYIQHNTTIGLQCFAAGLLGPPGLLIVVFNASFLGAVFGYMARPDVAAGTNFFQFVTAHGPFELTAIVLSAGAGLRLGNAWLDTGGLTRTASLVKIAKESMPLMGAAMVMFSMAALIEGFLSPSAAPYWIKATVAVVSSGLLMFYFVVLGFPRR